MNLNLIKLQNHDFHLLRLDGEALSKSYYDFAIMPCVLSLSWPTYSLLFKVALICSSVWTNLSSSPLRSVFCPPRTLQCDWRASISDFMSWFLSRRLLLLNLMLSYSFLETKIWSSKFLSLVSLSKTDDCNSLFLTSSESAFL